MTARNVAGINRLLKQADMVERLTQQGVDPAQNTPDSFSRHIKLEVERFGKTVKETGARVDSCSVGG